MRVLITGGTGKLGKELCRVFSDSIAPSRKEMDITNRERISSIFLTQQIDLVIHTAALTDIRRCEEDWKKAEEVNIHGTWNIIELCKIHGVKFVYISTACVFDGENAPFSEDSKPSPKNFYSLTKFTAEQLIRCILTNYVIIRTNFVARESWNYPKAFTDRYGTYLFADDLARGIFSVIQRDICGVVHVCGSERMSMFELAKITTPDIEPMTMEDYYGPPLTRDMSLSSVRIEAFTITR